MADLAPARPHHMAGAPDETRTETPAGVLPLLVAALSGGLLAQAGFYPRAQWYLGVLLAAAALVAVSPRVRPAGLAAAVPAGALAGWALANGAARHAGTAGMRYALLLAGVLAVAYAVAALTAPARAVLVKALLGVGAVIALTGWLGVLLHRPGWAWRGDDLWRAAATLTYPNATAAVLAMLALTALAHLASPPRRDHVPYALVLTLLLAGLGATFSRGGVLGLAIGLAVLAAILGPARLATAATMPAAGALVAVAGLVPSMSASTPTRPALAVSALLAGLLVGVSPLPRSRTTAIAAGTAALAVVGISLTAAHHAVAGIANTRATLASPDRTGALAAAWQVARTHLLTGAGPGLPQLAGGHSTYRYAHNEYVQVLAELGIAGLILLLAFLALVARYLLRARTDQVHRAAALAACAALAVHAGLDFLWHLPAIPLLAAALAGLAAPIPTGRPIPAVPIERGQQ